MRFQLYYHPLSSYCHKVLIALYESGTPFDAKFINLGDEADRAALAAHWPLCKFPVLVDGTLGTSMPESSTIIDYLNQHAPAAVPLIPADADGARTVRHWDRIFDNYIHTPVQHIVGDRIWQAQADMSRQRALIQSAYRVVDAQVARGTWATGAHFSLADCAASPALFYASVLEPLPADLPHLQAYFERLMARPSVQRVVKEAQPYFQYFPFAEALPERFRIGT